MGCNIKAGKIGTASILIVIAAMLFVSMLALCSIESAYSQGIEEYQFKDSGNDNSKTKTETPSTTPSSTSSGSIEGFKFKKGNFFSSIGDIFSGTKKVTSSIQWVMGWLGVSPQLSEIIIAIAMLLIVNLVLSILLRPLVPSIANYSLYISVLITSILMLFIGNMWWIYLILIGISLMVLGKFNILKLRRRKKDVNEQNKVNAAGGAKSLMDRIRFALQHGESFGDKLKMIFTSKEDREKVEKTLDDIRKFKMTFDPFILSLIRNLEILERAQARGEATPEEMIVLEQARRELADKISEYQRMNINEARALSRQIQALQQRGISI